jgi:RNA polymerase sigma-70 factor (sigma-E family)
MPWVPVMVGRHGVHLRRPTRLGLRRRRFGIFRRSVHNCGISDCTHLTAPVLDPCGPKRLPLYPHVMTRTFAARSADVVPRTCVGLFAWTALLAVVALAGLRAAAAGVHVGRTPHHRQAARACLRWIAGLTGKSDGCSRIDAPVAAREGGGKARHNGHRPGMAGGRNAPSVVCDGPPMNPRGRDDEGTAADVAAGGALDLRTAEREAALTWLFDRHYPELLRLAALLGAGQEAEGFVTEAFCQLHRHWPRLRDPMAAPGYLRSVVCNLVRMHLRHLQVVRRHAEQRLPDSDSAESQVVLREDQREVMTALRRLPERQRQALVLRYWMDLREHEIAEAMGITTGAVKAHISRGMAALTRYLTASPALPAVPRSSAEVGVLP